MIPVFAVALILMNLCTFPYMQQKEKQLVQVMETQNDPLGEIPGYWSKTGKATTLYLKHEIRKAFEDLESGE